MALLTKRDFVRTRAVPEAPDPFDAVIRENWRGVARITVGSETDDGGKFHVVNAITFDRSGLEEEPPGVLVEEAIEEVMAIVTADMLAAKRTQHQYRVQVFPHAKNGKRPSPATATAKIAAGMITRDARIEPSQLSLDLSVLNYVDGIQGKFLEMADRLIRGMDSITKALDAERKHTDAKTRREVVMLEQMEKQIEERARVRAETAEVEASKEIELARIAQQDRAIDAVEPLIQGAIQKKALGAAKKKAKEQAKKNKLSAAKSAKKSDGDGDGDGAAERGDRPDPDDGRTDAEIEELAENHPQLFMAQTLRDGLTEEQRGKIGEALGAERFDALMAAADAESNGGCLEKLRAAFAGVEATRVARLLPIFDESQLTMLQGLKQAAEETANNDHD